MCWAVSLRILSADFLEHALPQAPGVGHGVRLIAHQDRFARRAVELGVALAILKCVANDALDPLPGVDVFLGGDFVGRALLEDAAGIGVNALGVFAEHDEIHVFGLDSLQRTKGGIEQADRAHVGVEIHFEAHAEQDFFGVDVGLDPWIAECARQDRIEIAAQHGEAVGGHRDLVAKVAIGAPVEVGQLNVGAGGLNDFHRLGNDFLAYAVAGDHGYASSCLSFFESTAGKLTQSL